MRSIGYSVVKFSVPILAAALFIISSIMDLFNDGTSYWLFGLIAFMTILVCFIYSNGLFEVENFILAVDKEYNNGKKLSQLQDSQNSSDHGLARKKQHWLTKIIMRSNLVILIRSFFAIMKLIFMMFFKPYSWARSYIHKLQKSTHSSQEYVLISQNNSDPISSDIDTQSKHRTSTNQKRGKNLIDIFEAEPERRDSTMMESSRSYSFYGEEAFPSQNAGYEKRSRIKHSKEYQNLLLEFERFLVQKAIEKEDFYKYISNIKITIGGHILDVVSKNKENISSIKSTSEKIFDVNVVDKAILETENSIAQYGNFTQQTRQNKKITIEQIIESQKQNIIQKGVWPLKDNFLKQARAEKSTAFQQLKQMISQRVRLDKEINFDNQFSSEKERQIVLEQLKGIGTALIKKTNLTKYSKKEDHGLRMNEINKIILFVMRNLINNLVTKEVPEAKIFLDQNYTDLHNQSRKNYIKIFGNLFEHGSQYNLQFMQKIGDQEQIVNFMGKPGDDNIFSIFIWYAVLLKEKYYKRIVNIPKMQAFLESAIMI